MQYSLVPRSYPLTWKNRPGNQVKFLTLVHTFVTATQLALFLGSPLALMKNTGRKMKFPTCPVDMKFDISLTIIHTNHVGDRAKHHMCMTFGCIPYRIGGSRIVNEMSDFMSTGQRRNFIVGPVKYFSSERGESLGLKLSPSII